MSSRSSHASFLLYFQKMLLKANCESEQSPGNRKVQKTFPMVRKRRLLQGPSLVGPEISPAPSVSVKAPGKGPKLR